MQVTRGGVNAVLLPACDPRHVPEINVFWFLDFALYPPVNLRFIVRTEVAPHSEIIIREVAERP